MKINHDDIVDALEYAHRNGADIAFNPKLSKAENYAAIMLAGDNAGQDALKRHTFVLCDCCTHPNN